MVSPASSAVLQEADIVVAVCNHFSNVQAIYLFGSVAEGTETATSDIDLALLLTPRQSRMHKQNFFMHALHRELRALTHHNVDLLNLRQLPTVLQKEIIMTGTRIYCADQLAVDEFEVAVLSRYQKLNQERAAILFEFESTGRAYDV